MRFSASTTACALQPRDSSILGLNASEPLLLIYCCTTYTRNVRSTYAAAHTHVLRLLECLWPLGRTKGVPHSRDAGQWMGGVKVGNGGGILSHQPNVNSLRAASFYLPAMGATVVDCSKTKTQLLLLAALEVR